MTPDSTSRGSAQRLPPSSASMRNSSSPLLAVRCKLVCFGLHGRFASASSKSHAGRTRLLGSRFTGEPRGLSLVLCSLRVRLASPRPQDRLRRAGQFPPRAFSVSEALPATFRFPSGESSSAGVPVFEVDGRVQIAVDHVSALPTWHFCRLFAVGKMDRAIESGIGVIADRVRRSRVHACRAFAGTPNPVVCVYHHE